MTLTSQALTGWLKPWSTLYRVQPVLVVLAASVLALVACANKTGVEERGVFRGANPRDNVKQTDIYDRSYAVVIGIDDYDNLKKLDGAVRDAREIASVLESRGFDVTSLLDGQATRSAIAEQLGDRLPTRLTSNDRVVVFFAGHGVSTGGSEARMGYLMPVEGKRNAMRSTGVSMSELQNWLAGYDAKHVLFLADACYSGLALSTRSIGIDPGTKAYLHEITTNRVRYTLVAGRDDQEAYEDSQSGHGIFTRFVLEGLSGAGDANRDGLVTSDELSTYVKPRVSTYVAQYYSSSQTPQSARSGMGEFVFFSNTRAPLAEVRAGAGSKLNPGVDDRGSRTSPKPMCGGRYPSSKPLVVEWARADKNFLLAQIPVGVIAVRYEGCEMEVLADCTSDHQYDYVGIYSKREGVRITEADQLYAQLPVGAAGLENKLMREDEINVEYTVVGRYEADTYRFTEKDVAAHCAEATHVITGMTLGAYVMYVGKPAGAEADPDVVNKGIGMSSFRSEQLLVRDGDASACSTASSADESAPEHCRALLRVEVSPIERR